MATIERFGELDVWKRARELANSIYSLSEIGQFAKDYGMRDQMRRVAVSLMSNIAEGFESRIQAETCSKQLARFMQYLESKPNVRRVRDEGVIYDI